MAHRASVHGQRRQLLVDGLRSDMLSLVTSDASPLVLSGWARTVIYAVDKLGADSETVLQSAGVSREMLEGDAELPITVTTTLGREAARATGDPAFGLARSPTRTRNWLDTTKRAVASYLARLGQVNVTDRVRATILQELPSGDLTVGRVAKLMGTSPRSLQRQLSAADTTFGATVDDVRHELARAYLAEEDRSTTEIAFLLGFADGSAFSRAFKRWTGRSPAAFRADHERWRNS